MDYYQKWEERYTRSQKEIRTALAALQKSVDDQPWKQLVEQSETTSREQREKIELAVMAAIERQDMQRKRDFRALEDALQRRYIRIIGMLADLTERLGESETDVDDKP